MSHTHEEEMCSQTRDHLHTHTARFQLCRLQTIEYIMSYGLDLHTYAVCDRFTQYKSPDQPAFILLLVLQHAQVLFRHGRCCFLIGWGGNKTWRMRTDWLNVKSGEWKEFYLSRLSEGLWFGLGVVLSVCLSCPAAPRSPETRRKRS